MERQEYNITAYTENHIGLLNRIAIIFSRRKINIESLNTSPSEIEGIHRFNIVITETEEVVRKICRQMEKQVEVLKTYFNYGIALRLVLTGGLLIAGTLFVVSRQMSLGQFVAAEVLIVQISSAIEKLVSGVSTVFDMLTGAEKLAAVTDLPLEEAKSQTTKTHA